VTRGINEAFLENRVGEELTGKKGKSAAGVLLVATAQGIPLIYVDTENLEPLAEVPLSDQAKARIVQAAQQGYAIMVPERMVAWNRQLTTAWWQIDPQSGEAVGVGEDGTHQFLVTFTAEARLLAITLEMMKMYSDILVFRKEAWNSAVNMTWEHFWLEAGGSSNSDKTMIQVYQDALKSAKLYMGTTTFGFPGMGRVKFYLDCKRKLADDKDIMCIFAW
jgi:hypothetical protein